MLANSLETALAEQEQAAPGGAEETKEGTPAPGGATPEARASCFTENAIALGEPILSSLALLLAP